MASVAELTLVLQGKDDLSKTLKSVSTETATFNTKIKESGEKASGAAGGFDKAEKSAGGLGATLGGVAKIATGFVIGAGLTKLPGLIGGMIGGASDLNENLSKVQAVFGTSSSEIERFAGAAAQNLGTTKSEALALTGTLGNLFGALGLNKDQMVNMSESTVQLATDLGSFNNLPTADVLEKLRAGLVGEAEPLRSLGVTMNAATVEAKALALSHKSVASELTESDKVMARYQIIMEQTKSAQGDFARTASGHANQMKILKAEFGNLRDELGSKLLPVVVSTGQAFIDYVVPGLQKAAELASNVVDVLADFGRYLSAVNDDGDTLNDWLSHLPGFLQPAAQFMGEMLVHLKDLAAFSWDFVSSTLWPFIQDLGGAIGEKAAEYLGIAKDALVEAAGVSFEFITGTLWPFLRDVGGTLGQAVSDRLGDIRDAFAGLGGDTTAIDFADFRASLADLKEKLQPAVDLVRPLAEHLLADLREGFDSLKTSAQPLTEELAKWQPILEPLGKVTIGALTLAVAALIIQIDILVKTTLLALKLSLDAITLTLEAVRLAFDGARAFAETFGTAVSTAAADVATAGEAIIQWFRDLPANVLTAIGDVTATLKQKGLDLLTGMSDGVVEKGLDLYKTIAAIPGSLVTAIGDIRWLLYDIGAALIEGLKDGIVDKWNAVKDIVLDIVDPRNWDIPGRSPLFEAMTHTGTDAGKLLVQGIVTGIVADGSAVAGAMTDVVNRIDDVVTSGLIPAVSQLDGWWNVPGAADVVKGWNSGGAPPPGGTPGGVWDGGKWVPYAGWKPGQGDYDNWNGGQFASGGFGGIPGAMDPSQWGGGGGGTTYLWGNPYTMSANQGGVTATRGRGGDNHIQIHINALDGDSVRRLIPQIADELSRELGRNYA